MSTNLPTDKPTNLPAGSQHPLLQTVAEIHAIFRDLGFSVTSGPERETEWYNFDVLNVPGDHPARDMQDTFWVEEKSELTDRNSSTLESVSHRRVLRTHTTSATARALTADSAAGKYPVSPTTNEPISSYVSIGKVFRNEATDATHEMQFFQVDGCMVGTDVSLANLKYVLLELYKRVLGEDVEIQLRPSYFPFVEPGLEVWVKFRDRWLEVMGAGMLHPNVLRNCGIDPDVYQGFAFGGGVDRIVMVKYGIPDVRYLYQGDLRLNQW